MNHKSMTHVNLGRFSSSPQGANDQVLIANGVQEVKSKSLYIWQSLYMVQTQWWRGIAMQGVSETCYVSNSEGFILLGGPYTDVGKEGLTCGDSFLIVLSLTH